MAVFPGPSGSHAPGAKRRRQVAAGDCETGNFEGSHGGHASSAAAELGPLGDTVKVAPLDGKGLALIAARSFLPGDIVLQEVPLLLVKAPESGEWDPRCEDLEAESGFEAAMWASYFCGLALRALPDGITKLRRIFELYVPLDSEKATAWRNLLEDVKLEVIELLPDFDLDFFLRLNIALAFNGCSCRVPEPAADGTLQDKYIGDGIYPTASRINHSCAPNVACYVADDDGTLVVRALRPIAAAQELCFSYLGSTALLSPTWQRRRRLKASKEFFCQCARCADTQAGAGDDVLVYDCTARDGCDGSVRLCCQDGSPTTTAGQTAECNASSCSRCRAAMSSPSVALLLSKEASLLSEVEALEELLSLPAGCVMASTTALVDVGLQRRVLSLTVLHRHHHLTRRVARLQRAVWQRRLQEQSSSRAALEGYLAAARLEEAAWAPLARDAPSRQWAACLEMLGDAYDALRQHSGAETEAWCLQEAARCFDSSVRVYKIGLGAPIVERMSVSAKLRRSQMLLQSSS
eukprot:TRINITY_DN19316_c0_g2_i3.p1 TRINITY_DN19316_c0_g2~~TRINITY_DN19316_c0_g2_i3.p1  ORF type:complete len:521 (+),score=108.84 TRINITY_DN19316_c0_g2_i3:115-1677(+)